MTPDECRSPSLTAHPVGVTSNPQIRWAKVGAGTEATYILLASSPDPSLAVGVPEPAAVGIVDSELVDALIRYRAAVDRLYAPGGVFGPPLPLGVRLTAVWAAFVARWRR